jgi:acetyl esterase
MWFPINFNCQEIHYNAHTGSSIPQEWSTLLPLDDETRQFLALNRPSDHLINMPTFLKAIRRQEARPFPKREKLNRIKTIQEIIINGTHGHIPLRLYTPEVKIDTTLPVLVFFHGGGWVSGTLDSCDLFCQRLCAEIQCLVVSVDYHRAPEYPFPIPVQDCYEATQWVAQSIQLFGGDTQRIAVGGDSAGGNLAAAVALMTRDQKGPKLIYQMLLYPVLENNFHTLSYQLFGEGYLLSREAMKFFWEQYLQGQEGHQPYASPLAASHLRRLPPVLLVIPEYDPLRDEGLAYGRRLRQDNIPVTVKKYGTIHGFIGHPLPIAEQAIQEITRILKGVFSQELSKNSI